MTRALLLTGLLVGCATIPPEMPRIPPNELARADDQTVCVASHLYPDTHIDVGMLRREYQGRQLAGRFTDAQCRNFYQSLMANKAAVERSAQLQVLGELLVGAAQAYGNRPIPSYDLPRNTPVQPVKPIGLALVSSHRTYLKGVYQLVCYYGSAGSMMLPGDGTCPANYPY